MKKAVGVKKIVISLLLVGPVSAVQVMEPGLENGAEEKVSPEIELLIGAAGGDQQQPGMSWTRLQQFLSPKDQKELLRNHTSQELDEVFKTFILPQNPADCMQNFLLALIKHDKARFADVAAKNQRNHSSESGCIKSFLRVYSLGAIGIVIILCGAVRVQCGN